MKITMEVIMKYNSEEDLKAIWPEIMAELQSQIGNEKITYNNEKYNNEISSEVKMLVADKLLKAPKCKEVVFCGYTVKRS